MKKLALIFGILHGLIALIMQILYHNGRIGNTMNSIISFTLLFGVFFVVGFLYKKSQDGFASFGELVKLFFVTGSMTVGLQFVGQLVLSQIYSEDKKVEIAQRITDMQIEMQRSFGIFSEVQLASMEDKMMDDSKNMFKPGFLIMGLVGNLVIYLLLALIPTAILKKNKKK